MLKCWFILGLSVSLSGCNTVAYYWQAASGQLELLNKRQHISALLHADSQLPKATQARLQLALTARDFASTELHLPDNGSYREYADLGRPYATWIVSAAPELSLAPHTWCYPIAGCVAYRGFFDQTDAKTEANQLQAEGLDVNVSGVPAYSTLGWFDDPLLNTMMHWSDLRLAELIFHELAHQQVYAPGDTAFNESFATAVAAEGLRRWATQHASATQLATLQQQKQRQRQFNRLLLDYRQRLAAAYAAEQDDDSKRQAKSQYLQALQADYQQLKLSWDGYGGYDAWMAEGINNAKLASVANYQQWVPAFQALLAASNSHLPTFYSKVEALAALDESQRHQQLNDLTTGATQATQAQ